AGESFSYMVDLGNIDSSSLDETELRVELPAGVTVSSISDGGVEESAGVVVWTEGSVSSGSAFTRQIDVISNDSVVGGEVLGIMAYLSFEGSLEVDLRSEFTITVSTDSPILSANMSTLSTSVSSGSILSYVLEVSNNSALAVEDVYIQLRTPSEISFHDTIDVEPNSFNCLNDICSLSSTQEAIWAFASIAAGATEVITIDASVAAGLTDGSLIVTPIRVTATDLEDVINLQKVTPVNN
ncbi:hypothetical protein, partial [Paraglaciecola sp. 2405UD69-4]|uniref:hypothetical protein n=1 Tax=Paraglaciecola sp. 2405UD69-4 TaxID=3391836 RepID=UPI0039C8E163